MKAALEVRTVSVGELDPAWYNPRKDLTADDAEYQRLAKSLDAFGYVEPIVWNQRSGRVVGGHQRLKILLEAGVTEVQVSVVDLDDDLERALNVALNKPAGEWDVPRLKDVLESLDTGAIDLEVTGFSQQELHALFIGRTAEDGGEDPGAGKGGQGCPHWEDGRCCRPDAG